MVNQLHPATRSALQPLAVEVAPTLLGGVLRTEVDGEVVAIRITEVEAYHGRGSGEIPDPGSHARMGQTARNSTMWGEAGHLYVYLSHGIHSCVNVACGPAGRGDGVLLRAGEVVEGAEIARSRRSVRKASMPAGCAPRISDRDLARGPGRLGQALGLHYPVDDGLDAITAEPGASGASAQLWMLDAPVANVRQGPRVGVAGVAGTAAFPWRFWIDQDKTVSPFRFGRGAADLA